METVELDDSAQEGEGEPSVPVVEGGSSDPIIVTNVDYCLMCGEIAVLYDLEGNIMKREMVEMPYGGADVTYQDLFDYLCLCLGFRKNSTLKKDWNFYTGPFPFCVDCEKDMHNVALIYQQINAYKDKVKRRMTVAEEKYVKEELYGKQDYRYLEFRRRALGELFRGDLEAVAQRRRSQRLSKLKIESTTSVNVTDVKDEEGPNSPAASDENDESSNEPQPSTSTSCTNGVSNFKSDKTQDEMQQSVEPLENSPLKPKRITPERRRSLRLRNKSTNYRDNTSPEIEVYMENVITGQTSNTVKVKDENGNNGKSLSRRHSVAGDRKRKRETEELNVIQTRRRSLSHVKFASTSENGNNAVAGFSGGNKRLASIKSDNNVSDWIDCVTPSQIKRRGRPPKNDSSLARDVKKEVKESAQGSIRRRKEYAARKIKIETDVNDEGVVDTSLGMGNTESFLMAPLCKDPLSGNIYYRTVQFVWIKERNAFQCSTCSAFILNNIDSTLKLKFHNHFLKFHSDRFKCRLCPEFNQFQSDLELHQHFRHSHKKKYHIEPDCRPQTAITRSVKMPGMPKKYRKYKTQQQSLPINNAGMITKYLKSEEKFNAIPKTETKIHGQFSSSSNGTNLFGFGSPSKSAKRNCPICGKSGIALDDFKKHRMSHMNKQEKDQFLKESSAVAVVSNTIFSRKRLQGQRKLTRDKGKGRKDDKDYVAPISKKISPKTSKFNGSRRMSARLSLVSKEPKVEEVSERPQVLEEPVPEPSQFLAEAGPEPPQFSCSQCDWKTISELCFSIHMEHHERQKQNQDDTTEVDSSVITSCRYPMCGRNFSFEEELEQHVGQEHNDEFMCKSCGRVFLNQQRLTTHGIIHSKNRNHECHICQMGFAYGFLLREHLAAVHGEGESLICQEPGCGAEFKSRTFYNSHLRKVHGMSKRKSRGPLEESLGEERNNIMEEKKEEEIILPSTSRVSPEIQERRKSNRREVSMEELGSEMGFTLPPFNLNNSFSN